MKKLFLSVFAFCSVVVNAQEDPVVQWLNTNAITIEDANPKTTPEAFAKNAPQKFKDARIFGFGEASHNTKEFFDLKAKFFKYLVEHQGVKLFIMEESYVAEEGINRWISGGEGDVATIKDNFTMSIWQASEVIAMLQWMRDYNTGKSKEQQVRFYGMDNQSARGLSTKLRTYVKKHGLDVQEELLAAVDSCAAGALKAGGIKGWSDKMMPKLKQLRQILESESGRLKKANDDEYYDAMRAFTNLEEYTMHIAAPYVHNREKDMYLNVVEIMEHNGPESKAFVWAHNVHVDKKSFGHFNMASVGAHIKKHYGDKYYCVGFDFGGGKIFGSLIKNGQVIGGHRYDFKEPFKGTFAETFNKANKDIFFFDMDTAVADKAMGKFLNSKKKQLFLGGGGYNPDNAIFMKEKLAEHYDGFIFVKNVLVAR